MIRDIIKDEIVSAVSALIEKTMLTDDAQRVAQGLSLSRIKDEKLGDMATNLAMLLAKSEKKAPLAVASMIADELRGSPMFSNIEAKAPGFINFTLSPATLARIIPYIARRGKDYGRATTRHETPALVEFVSANPTGGLHLGHARGAFVGDALARVLDAAGYKTTKEFYINDTGNQVATLARTIHKRYRELFGDEITIDAGEYPGEYVVDIAVALKSLHGERWLNQPEEVWLNPLIQFGVEYNLALIKRSLQNVDIDMDVWYYESSLHKEKKLDDLVTALDKRGMLYEADEAKDTEGKVRRTESKAAKFAHLQSGGIFVSTSQFGDEEDRIIKRRDGSFVYLTADLAYHHQKFLRKFDLIIDVFGADHAGHVGRIKAGMAALGHDLDKLKFVLVQIVRLLKGGTEMRFSKRTGTVISLDELIDDVGKDVARFVFLMRGANAQFDLDLDVVTEQSNDNPVFYVQYGHARIATVLARAAGEGITVDARDFSESLQAQLRLPEEREMQLMIAELEDLVKESAQALEPHRLIYYCQSLIKTFHTYFTKYRHQEKIITDDAATTEARLMLVSAVKQTIFNALSFLGISAPDHMRSSGSDDVSVSQSY